MGDALYETGRWQSISVKFHRSSEIIHVVSVYGFSRANEGGEAMVENVKFYGTSLPGGRVSGFWLGGFLR